MASAVDISNLALSHLGEQPLVTALTPVPSGGAYASKCAIFYPIARDAFLEMHDWGFATRRKTLGELALGDDLPPAWAYAYEFPSDCVKPRRVLPPGAPANLLPPPGGAQPVALDDDRGQDFKVEMTPTGVKVIYTNVEDAVLIYTRQVTDTTKFTPLFVLALSRLLAAHLAGPVIKGETGMKVAAAQMRIFLELEGARAMSSDANARQSNPYTTAIPSAIAARA